MPVPAEFAHIFAAVEAEFGWLTLDDLFATEDMADNPTTREILCSKVFGVEVDGVYVMPGFVRKPTGVPRGFVYTDQPDVALCSFKDTLSQWEMFEWLLTPPRPERPAPRRRGEHPPRPCCRPGHDGLLLHADADQVPTRTRSRAGPHP